MKKYKKKLRVMADVECSGIWEVDPPDYPEETRHIMIDFDELGLPEALADKFHMWTEDYWGYIDRPKKFDLVTYNRRGKQLAKDLKTFLGDDYYVEYEPEAEPHIQKGEEIVS